MRRAQDAVEIQPDFENLALGKRFFGPEADTIAAQVLGRGIKLLKADLPPNARAQA